MNDVGARILRIREDELRSAVAEYRSPFRRWYDRAGVRTKPRRVLGDGGGTGRVLFPPELVDVLDHRLVAALGDEARQTLLAHRLYQYLHFTVELEQVAVVPVTSAIARGRYQGLVPSVMREDAFAITTDEAWHAQISYDLIGQVHRLTGIDVVLPREPQFWTRYRRIRASVEPESRPVLDLLFSCVTETLISSTLAELPKDDRLPDAVRAVVADHAEDEGRHHAYFRRILTHLWPALDARHRRSLGPLLPELVFAFLDPDLGATALSLTSVGLDGAQADEVLHDSVLESPTTRAATRRAALSTIRYLDEVGALEDPATRDAFAATGLLTART